MFVCTRVFLRSTVCVYIGTIVYTLLLCTYVYRYYSIFLLRCKCVYCRGGVGGAAKDSATGQLPSAISVKEAATRVARGARTAPIRKKPLIGSFVTSLERLLLTLATKQRSLLEHVRSDRGWTTNDERKSVETAPRGAAGRASANQTGKRRK